MLRMLKRYIPSFHPDKLDRHADKEQEAEANLHSRRLVGLKEWFKDDQQRYFYDRKLDKLEDGFLSTCLVQVPSAPGPDATIGIGGQPLDSPKKVVGHGDPH